MARNSTFDASAYDEAAEAAQQELKTMDQEQVKAMADWWAKHYLKAGHKRLGRTMVAISKGTLKLQ